LVTYRIAKKRHAQKYYTFTLDVVQYFEQYQGFMTVSFLVYIQ